MMNEDAELKLSVEKLLRDEPLIDASGIEVFSELGFINLNGHVQDEEQKKLVEVTVASLHGVKQVFNYLTLKPKGLIS